MLPYGYWQRSAKELAIIHPANVHMGNRGYINIKRDGKTHLLHRWLWEELVGPIPAGHEIDHENGLRNDCRLTNLRVVQKVGNMRNRKKQRHNTSGITGVGRYLVATVPYWIASWKDPVSGKGRQKAFNANNLGEVVAKQSAVDHREAIMADLREHHGYTERHGV